MYYKQRKKWKIGELVLDGTFTIYYNSEDDANHYWLYREWWGNGKHKKLIAKYGNLSSIVAYIYEYVLNHDEERR